MAPWANRVAKTIPNLRSPSNTYEFNDYSKGMDSFIGTDKFPVDNGGSNLWRLAQNARITTLGEYETRKGFDFHSAPAGETQDTEQETVTGAADQSFSTTTRLAMPFTAAVTGKLSRLDVRLKNDASATGTILVEYWTNSGGSPGAMIARTSIAASLLTSSYAYLPVRFPDAPTVTASTAYWIVLYVQSTGTGSYKWSSTTAASTAKTSINSGTTWSAAAFDLNFKQFYATTDGVKGICRAYKSDGTAITLFAHGTVLYSVNEITGVLTTVKSGLNAGATHYRFAVVNDRVYYVNGFDGYRKWDFTTESQVNATNYTNILEHKGLMFLNQKNDPNRWDFSNFAEYETFTSTDFIYVPSPKTGDPSTAAVSLNGYLLIWTRNSKYILSGDDNATFRLDVAPDQKGTFTQETVTNDDNYAYYASDDGVYQTNGTQPKMLSEGIFEDYLNITNKENTCINVNKGRLRLWYASPGSSNNDKCWVWNLNYGSGKQDVVESFDTNAYVKRAFSAFNDDNDLLVGSSNIGQVYWQELGSNDYTNLGGDIDFLLQTHYMPFQIPTVLKEIRFWKARFAAQSGNYNISCEYAYDLRDNWQVQSILSTQGSGYVWGDSGTVWGAFTWGTTAELQNDMYVPGEYRRIGIRYKHFATRQPHTFLGQTFVVQTRRMR